MWGYPWDTCTIAYIADSSTRKCYFGKVAADYTFSVDRPFLQNSNNLPSKVIEFTPIKFSPRAGHLCVFIASGLTAVILRTMKQAFS